MKSEKLGQSAPASNPPVLESRPDNRPDENDNSARSSRESSVSSKGSETHRRVITKPSDKTPRTNRFGSIVSVISSVQDLARTVSDRIHGRPATAQERDIIREQLFKDPQLRLFIGTWNMHGKPPPMDLAPFLKRAVPFSSNPQIGHHIIAIGTQECERSIEKSVIYPSKEIWEAFLRDYLSARYELVRSETMAAIHLAVFVLKEIKHLVEKCESASIATGIGNVIGNKGGVGVGISLANNTSFLFINSHFTAHQSRVSERNNDFHRIKTEIPLTGFHKSKGKNDDITDKYDYTVWFGDLNYRINGTRKIVDSLISQNMLEVLLANDQLTIERNKGTVFVGFQEAEIKFPPTYKFDVPKMVKMSSPTQEIDTRKHKSSFGFRRSKNFSRRSKSLSPTGEENPALNEIADIGTGTSAHTSLNRPPHIQTSQISRPVSLIEKSPTSTSSYDSSKKQRIPSWTDRILCKSRHTNVTIVDEKTKRKRKSQVLNVPPMKIETYNSCMEMYWSDHKPVYAECSVDVNWRSMFEKPRTTTATKLGTNICNIM